MANYNTESFLVAPAADVVVVSCLFIDIFWVQYRNDKVCALVFNNIFIIKLCCKGVFFGRVTRTVWNHDNPAKQQIYLFILMRLFFLIRILIFLLYPMRSMEESIGIGLEASSTSKGPQTKNTEPMDSTKVTYCSIQLG